MIIFISAGFIRNGMGWLLGVTFLLVILVIRNVFGEVTKTQEFFLSLLIFVIVLATLLLFI